jgi:hypothetical protein
LYGRQHLQVSQHSARFIAIVTVKQILVVGGSTITVVFRIPFAPYVVQKRKIKNRSEREKGNT